MCLYKNDNFIITLNLKLAKALKNVTIEWRLVIYKYVTVNDRNLEKIEIESKR